MKIRSCAENIIIVDLPQEQEMLSTLDSIIETVQIRDYCDVVVSFSRVDIVSSSGFARLLQLRRLLTDRGHRLVLCSLAANTIREFEVIALDQVFEFACDKTAAIAAIKDAEEPKRNIPSPAR
jgi:anti-anti-sigma factor